MRKIACLFLLFSVSEIGFAASYVATDLGSLGGPTAIARGINNLGHVVGEADTAGGNRHAFIWIDASMQDLNVPIEPSVALAINSLDQVVGSGGYPYPNPNSGFLWTSIGGIQTLASLPGGPYTIGQGINVVGQIVGTSTTPDPHTRAILWSTASSAPQDIGGGGPSSQAYAVNNSGQMVGWTNNWGGTIAFSRTNTGTLVDLGTLPGDSASYSSGINDLGQVVGASWVDGTTTLHAFQWTSGGGMQGLGTLGGNSSVALGVNVSGQVVGWANIALGDVHAFLWQNGGIVDLNTLISDPTWILVQATAINDGGQIVGYGIHNGQTRAFVLNPAPQVPASKDACKGGGWQNLHRADGSSFKNQGDCIQYVNTGK